MNDIDQLRNIWQNIPKTTTHQLDISQNEMINRYMDIFHFGECFYAIFNTRTAEMEYVSPNIKGVLGLESQNFKLQKVLDSIHPEDIPYYFHYEQSAVRFFSKLEPDLFFKYKFAYDYRFKIMDGSYKRLQQQIVPLYYFSEGGVRTLVIFTDLTHLNIQGTPKLSFIGMQGAPSYYNIHLQKEFNLAPNLFTKREKEILRYNP